MPYKVPNVLSYSPFGHGGGLTKAVANLFGGGNQADGALKQSQADMNRAHGEYYLAQRDAALAKMEAEAQARRDMAAAPMEAITPLFGSRPQAQMWMDSMNNGSTPVAEFRPPADVDTGVAQQPAELVPQQFNPTAVARAGRLMTALGAMKAMPGNDNGKHLADAIAGLYADEVKQGALNGTVTTPQIQRVGAATAATGGHALYKNLGEVGTFNQFTGEQALNPLGNAKVVTEGAHAGAYRGQEANSRAAAGEHAARAKKVGVETDQLKADVLVPVLEPTTRTPMLGPDNKPIMIRASEQGKILQRGEDKRATRDNDAANAPPKPGTQAQPRKLTKNDTTLLRNETDALLSSLDAEDADEQTKRAIVAEAERQWQAGAAGHAGAVKAAVDKLAPQGFERDGIIGFRKSRPVGGAQSGGAITPAPASGAPAPAAAAPVKLPTVRSEADVQRAIDEANAAIKKGADPAKVKQRLEQMGIKLKDA